MVQQPYSPAPQPRQNPVNVVLIVVCVGLAVLLLVAVGIVGFRLMGPHPAAPPTTPATPAAVTPTLPPPVQATPGPDAALAKALEARPGWNGRITYSSGDWTQVKAVTGPSDSSQEAVAMHWDASLGSYVVDSITALAAPTTIYQSPTVIVQPQAPTIVRRRGNPARPRGGVVTPEATPGYDGNYPVTPGGGNQGTGGAGNPATPRGGGGVTPGDTPGRD